ncbi:MAG TPA: Gfo/Idh/MocA family oxidoreductase [Candidatus Acidoferrales bacterium]|nr:Gfo/Idh/MocA family oxidoreductase [Candidatus Acidoferrales bacterium]
MNHQVSQSPESGSTGASKSEGISRRSLLLGGATTLGSTAVSYSRVIGANERISLAQVGIGNRGRELASVVAGLRSEHNAEMTAVCDLWSVNRERAVKAAASAYGREPRSFQYVEDLLALKDVDAVIISTADFQHAPLLLMAAEAGKDAYCEKPMGNVLEEAKAARDAVRAHKRVVQVGTQHRSEPYERAAKEQVDRGVLGQVSKVEVVWNYHGPRWRGRPEVKQIREEDTDWRKWLLGKPYRPFDPRLYFEFRLYREFSSGIPDQWMTHAIDMVHYLLDDHFPTSAMAHGGVYRWRDGRENPDTFQALLEYPKGFLVSYATSFANDSDSFTRIMGDKATLVNVGGEGSQRWKIVEEGGNHESNPFVHRSQKYVRLGSEQRQGSTFASRLLGGAIEKTYGPLPFTSDSNPTHMRNWLECLRTRKDPNATIDDGFAHSVAAIMAARAQREGKKLYWDARGEEIVDTGPATAAV